MAGKRCLNIVIDDIIALQPYSHDIVSMYLENIIRFIKFLLLTSCMIICLHAQILFSFVNKGINAEIHESFSIWWKLLSYYGWNKQNWVFFFFLDVSSVLLKPNWVLTKTKGKLIFYFIFLFFYYKEFLTLDVVVKNIV